MTQPDMFDPGAQLRDEGMKRAADHAESKEPTWKAQALAMIDRYPNPEFMTEQVRAWAYLHGLPKPPSERAWGAVTSEARRKGLIVHIGFKSVDNPKAHKTPASLWRKV